MNKQVVWAIAKKDIKSITSNSQVWMGFIITPILFCIIIPAVLILTAKYIPVTDSDMVQMLQKILKSLPEGEDRQTIESIHKTNYQLIYVAINYLLGSLFLMVPCLNSMMIAVNSFVSEKEGRTLESLLFAPISVKELFIGKMLASFIPVMVLTIGSFLSFVAVTDVLTYSMFDAPLLPNVNWLLLIFWLSPIISILTILFSVLVSAKVESFQAAQQLGSIVIIPILLILVSQATGFLILQPYIVFMIGVALLILCFLLLKRIIKLNNRNLLFEKQI